MRTKYFGADVAGELAARMDALRRAERKAQKEAWEAAVAELDAAPEVADWLFVRGNTGACRPRRPLPAPSREQHWRGRCLRVRSCWGWQGIHVGLGHAGVRNGCAMPILGMG